MLYPRYAAALYLSSQILDRFSVRIHSKIAEKGKVWAKLWYFFRGIDWDGTGFVVAEFSAVCQALDAKPSTVYQWLKLGQECAAFKWYDVKEGILRVRMGGLPKVCRHFDLRSDTKGVPCWGTTFEIPLFELPNLRAWATAATAQRLQQLSRYAAWRALPKSARKTYRLPQPDAFFPSEEEPNSHDSASGPLRCVLHIGQRRVFASKGFIPFGVNQHTIAYERGYRSDRTIQRHLKAVGMDSKQLVQCKAAYRLLSNAMEWETPGIAAEENIYLHRHRGEYHLTDQAGTVGGTHTQRIQPGRIFRYGERYWINRTNLYRPQVKLCSVKAARRKYRSILQTAAPPGDGTECSIRAFSRVGEVVPESNPGG